MSSQKEIIINLLEKNGSLTQREALIEHGIGRLAARVLDLRQEGYEIITTIEEAPNRYGETSKYARYFLLNKEGIKHGNNQSIH